MATPMHPFRCFTVFHCVAAALLLVGCGRATFVVGLAPGDRKLTETRVIDDGRAFSKKVALIDVSGLIVNADRRGLLSAGDNPVSSFAEALNRAGKDDKVEAVVVRINSPGGTVTASALMHDELKRFRERTGKPAVALMADTATSGGYYLACAADHVTAHPTTITGSVGVILQTVSVKPALEKWGVSLDAITSGPNKAAGSPLSDLTSEQRATLEALVDDFYAAFVEVVKEARPDIPDDVLARATDGRVVTGKQALEWGMVDAVGSLHDAVREAQRRAGLERADVVRYHRPLDYIGSAYAAAPAAPRVGDTNVTLLELNLGDAIPGFGTPVGFYYLWAPDLP